jgi:DNA-binding transcriptional ArsR family regulator
MRDVERRLKALASRPRLQILQYLKKHKTASVTDVAQAFNLSLATVSRHLLRLANLDIVVSQRRSQAVYYRISLAQDPLVAHVLRRI